MIEYAKFSPPVKLIDLEEVVNTRTPVYDIARDGDIRIKLDTDVNGQEWYVVRDDRRSEPPMGKVSCWAFPHFNGAHDQYRYEPVFYCFKTFAELLEAYPTERAVWGYNLEEYERRTRVYSPDYDPFLPDYQGDDKHSHLKLITRTEKAFIVNMTVTHSDGRKLKITTRIETPDREEAIHFAFDAVEFTLKDADDWDFELDSCIEEGETE